MRKQRLSSKSNVKSAAVPSGSHLLHVENQGHPSSSFAAHQIVPASEIIGVKLPVGQLVGRKSDQMLDSGFATKK